MKRQAVKSEKVTYLPVAGRTGSGRRPRLVLCLIMLAVVYSAALFASQQLHLSRLHRELSRIEANIAAVQRQNEEMLREIGMLHTPAYLEKMVRQELGMVRPGEVLFFFRDAGPSGR
jgi:cell division protein FtsL